MSNFIVNIAEGAYDDVVAALATVGHTLAPVETAVVTDVQAALKQTETLLENNGGQLLLSEALAVVDGVVTGNWSATVTTLVANAKAAGATTLAEEETLAGSTALQVAQVIKAQQTAAVAAAPATTDTPAA
jgi:hypothetical protein